MAITTKATIDGYYKVDLFFAEQPPNPPNPLVLHQNLPKAQSNMGLYVKVRSIRAFPQDIKALTKIETGTQLLQFLPNASPHDWPATLPGVCVTAPGETYEAVTISNSTGNVRLRIEELDVRDGFGSSTSSLNLVADRKII